MLCCYQAIRTLISHAAGDAGIDPARISFTRARDAIRSRISDSGCFSPSGLDDLAADLAFEITFHRNLVPSRPGRRYERKTKRPGGRYKTRKPGETTRLTPLTKIVFWPWPFHLNLMSLGHVRAWSIHLLPFATIGGSASSHIAPPLMRFLPERTASGPQGTPVSARAAPQLPRGCPAGRR